MSGAKFEPQWAYEWQITDSDWAQKILKLAKIEQYQYQYQWIAFIDICIYQYEEEWFNGAENVFDKVW